MKLSVGGHPADFELSSIILNFASALIIREQRETVHKRINDIEWNVCLNWANFSTIFA